MLTIKLRLAPEVVIGASIEITLSYANELPMLIKILGRKISFN